MAVDLNKRLLTTKSGRDFPFDELLLATGAHSFIPPVPGADKKGVFSLRTADDAMAIAQAAAHTKKAILLGGGLLGLEAGAALARMGLEVQVVEMFDRLLPRQLDKWGGDLLRKILENMGFSFHLGTMAQEITGDGSAQGLMLKNGESLAGGLVLFSAGIRGNMELAKAMNLKAENGLLVDDRMHTSVPHVWAAGDQIEHKGRLYGIWPASQEQGEVAGINMAGGSATYQGTVMSNSLKVVGVDLFSAGNIDADEKLESAVYKGNSVYRKIVVDQGKMVGAIFFGLTKGVRECKAAMAKGVDVSKFMDKMSRKDFDFSKLNNR